MPSGNLSVVKLYSEMSFTATVKITLKYLNVLIIRTITKACFIALLEHYF